MKSIKESVAKTLQKNYIPYAMSVILSRALPEIDGFKPSHRKILYTMYKMNLINGAKTKSANVIGQTMKLNPHGDSAIYQTLVRMTNGNEALLYPYIDSKGNFGKVYSKDMQYAASRYTEVKLNKICKHIFDDVDKNTVDFEPNYDGTTYEPVLLPVKFPTILVNANRGIAVGMASSICSFNLKEVVDATKILINDNNADIYNVLKGPDFPTGAMIKKDEEVFKEIIENGTGTFYIRSKYTYDKKNRCIEINEIPYTTTIEAIIEKIISLVKKGELKEISDVRDESDLNGLKIAIDLKRGTDEKEIMNYLYKNTSLEDAFSCNFNLIINGYPQQIGVRDILLNWLDFRMGCYRRKLKYDITKSEAELHLIEGLKKVLLDIDSVIDLIKNTKKEKEVIPRLMKFFMLDKKQAEFVANIKLRNINKEFILNRVNEEKRLIDLISSLKEEYSSDKLIYNEISRQLDEIVEKYDVGRKSSIEELDEIVIQKDNVVTNEEVVIVVTKEKYIKKMPLTYYSSDLEQKLKDDDYIVDIINAKNNEELIIFTNEANAYKLQIDDIEYIKANQMGRYLPNISDISKDEQIIRSVASNDFKGNIIFVFENGKINKTSLDTFKTKQNRKVLKNAYSTVSKIVSIFKVCEGDIIVLKRYCKKMKILAVKENVIPLRNSRTANGITVFKMTETSKIIEAKITNDKERYKKYIKSKIPSAGTNFTPFGEEI